MPQLCNKVQSCEDIIVVFTTTQRFDTWEVVVSMAREIEIRNKVIVIISTSYKLKRPEGEEEITN